MHTKRFNIVLPVHTKKALDTFTALHKVDKSLVIQRAITKMSDMEKYQPSMEGSHEKTETVSQQVTLSDTAYRMLTMWESLTGLRKSKLVAYALQETIEKEGGISNG